MSAITFGKALQLLLLLFIVILIASSTPLLSLLMSLATNEEGVCVGNGPAVSAGVAVQESELVPELVPVLLVVVISFLHAFTNGMIAVAPNAANPFFRKIFQISEFSLDQIVPSS